MRTSACFRGKLKNSRRYHRVASLKGAVDMEAQWAPVNVVLSG